MLQFLSKILKRLFGVLLCHYHVMVLQHSLGIGAALSLYSVHHNHRGPFFLFTCRLNSIDDLRKIVAVYLLGVPAETLEL